MEPASKNTALKTVGFGFAVQMAGWVGAAIFPIEAIRRGFPLVISAGLIIIMIGCRQLAESKGQSKWFGLLGFFSLLGFLVVWLLPSKK